MTNAYVLLTALPPTKGHLHLIQFASSLATHAHVILCTQPDEPFWQERLLALQKATQNLPNVLLHHIHKVLPQEPEQDPGFWDMWSDFLKMFGFQTGDYVVASEFYGLRLAEEVGGVFMPYDIDRSITPAKATKVRNDPIGLFDTILPEFQPYIRKTITIFGAESTGKTTLARALADYNKRNYFLPEWARPFLETVGPELVRTKMLAIHKGQRALQDQGQLLLDKPFVVQDTDLFSTYGYWFMKSRKLGSPHATVLDDAIDRKSDLYIMTRSNIPFEADPLRYGGDVREGDDNYWEAILKRYVHKDNYVVLESDDLEKRIGEALGHMYNLFDGILSYDRITKETLGV